MKGYNNGYGGYEPDDDYEGFEPTNNNDYNGFESEVNNSGYNQSNEYEQPNLGGYNPNQGLDNQFSGQQTLGGYNPNGYGQPNLNQLNSQINPNQSNLGGYNPNQGLEQTLGGYNPNEMNGYEAGNNNQNIVKSLKNNEKRQKKQAKKQKKLDKKQKKLEKKQSRSQKRFGKKQIKIPFIVWILLIIGIYFGCSKYAEIRFTEVASNYPFYFEENNNTGYITENFKVCTEYNDKIKTTWKSDSKLIEIHEDGMVIVNRPINKSQEVIIKETHRFLLGTYSREFKINLIKSKILDINKVEVITKEQLESNSYNRDMKVTTDKHGNITTMFGDFRNIKIQSYEDGIVLIDAYRDELGISNNISFESLKINCYKDYTNYVYKGVYNGISVDEQIITLVVDNSNYELIKISADFDREVPNAIINTKEIDIEKIIAEKEETTEFIVYNQEKVISNINGESTLVIKAMTYFKDGRSLLYYIDVNSEKVIKTENLDSTVIADCTGEDELGKELNFTAEENDTLFSGKNYYLYDSVRNIQTTDDNGMYSYIEYVREKYKGTGTEFSFGKLFHALMANGNMKLNELLQFNIRSNTPNFKDDVAAASYYNTQIVYDWYKENLDVISYDNAGGLISLRVNSNNGNDNASFNWSNGVLTICNANKNKYTYGNDLVVLGHEFTHGVFGTTLSHLDSSNNWHIGALNEAYADIFGTIIAKDSDWLLGENIDVETSNDTYVRDIGKMTGHNGKEDVQYATKYDSPDLDKECHAASVIISNVAYNMEKSDNFDWDDLRDIWYTSLMLGFDNNSDFLSCRRNVINAMEELNYSKELMDEVGTYFDNVAVYDEDYAYETKSSAVEGDFMLDNTVAKKYYIIRLPLFEIFGFDKSILIGEETSKISDSIIEERKDKIQQAFNNKKDTMHDILGNPLQIDYFQIPIGTADKVPGLIDAITNETANRLGDILSDAQDLSLSQEEVDEIEGVYRQVMDWFFQITLFEGTSYDLYDNLGLID